MLRNAEMSYNPKNRLRRRQTYFGDDKIVDLFMIVFVRPVRRNRHLAKYSAICLCTEICQKVRTCRKPHSLTALCVENILPFSAALATIHVQI